MEIILGYYPIALRIVACMVCASIGFRIPDIDLTPVLPLRHRSVWTHGPLVALAGLKLAEIYPDGRLFIVVFIVGVLIHLLEDSAPRSWKGGACINLFPVPISLPIMLSQFYIVAGVVVSAWVILKII